MSEVQRVTVTVKKSNTFLKMWEKLLYSYRGGGEEKGDYIHELLAP